MKSSNLLILGGTGFLGHHLLPMLSDAGYRVTVLSRNRDQHRDLWILPGVRVAIANVYDKSALRHWMRNVDAVINLVGLLNENGNDTFQRAHVDLTASVIAACKASGVQRLLQMSALKAGHGLSRYLQTRGEAEALIKRCGLDWTLLQSSVMYGEDGGLVERFAQLLRYTPMLPLARPHARMAPVYVGDVAEAIVGCLGDDTSTGRTFELYGPQTFELIELVRAVATAMDKRRWVMGLPDSLGRLQAAVAGHLPGKPFSTDNFLSLRTDSVGSVDGLQALGIKPHEFLRMLPQLFDGHGRMRRQRRHRSRV